MIPPPTEPAEPKTGQTGFWYELHDTDGRPLYRRIVQNPIRFDAEVFSPDPKESIRRIELPNPEGTFVLLAPDLGEARSVVLFSSPLERKAAAEEARELARFPLARQSRTGR